MITGSLESQCGLHDEDVLMRLFMKHLRELSGAMHAGGDLMSWLKELKAESERVFATGLTTLHEYTQSSASFCIYG